MSVNKKVIADRAMKLRFGKSEKPDSYDICKVCGITFGQHYPFPTIMCPDEKVKHISEINDALLEACEGMVCCGCSCDNCKQARAAIELAK